MYKGKHSRLTSTLQSVILKSSKAFNGILQALKENNFQSRWLHSTQHSENRWKKMGISRQTQNEAVHGQFMVTRGDLKECRTLRRKEGLNTKPQEE